VRYRLGIAAHRLWKTAFIENLEANIPDVKSCQPALSKELMKSIANILSISIVNDI
jgi:hypothetical protein